jgi:hypothetical protein
MLVGILFGGNGGSPRRGSGLLNNIGDPYNDRSGTLEVGNNSLGSGGSPLGKGGGSTTRIG